MDIIMNKEEAKKIIRIIPFAVFIILFIGLIDDIRWLIENASSFPMGFIINVLFCGCVLAGGIISKSKTLKSNSFLIAACLYGAGFILGIYTSSHSYGIEFLSVIGTLFCLAASAYSILCYTNEKKNEKENVFLTKCPLCNHDVSSNSKSCPNCGNKL